MELNKAAPHKVQSVSRVATAANKAPAKRNDNFILGFTVRFKDIFIEILALYFIVQNVSDVCLRVDFRELLIPKRERRRVRDFFTKGRVLCFPPRLRARVICHLRC